MLVNLNCKADQYSEAKDQAIKAAMIQSGFSEYMNKAQDYFKAAAYRQADKWGMRRAVGTVGFMALAVYKKQAAVKLRKDLVLYVDPKKKALTLTIQF